MWENCAVQRKAARCNTREGSSRL